ncbi:hypothetical protein Kpol_1023p107 [Vanderwaltozyma polyspora DSM 70294]|uniref:Uncharacterized protein n=1 Tax=Vanderwaltozyma polyspora (strain ATCC 22028 / DSM 70294 / BCRC 21397 / CBS 2163 / NBRC 10782 / NRRL Y-8283 / UCD 57-17) TaxID=436907 RepID=A7TFX4_VANPO|nr:uncharacterized protein Kpol_1023p107 [Vanderwaltozyma polyspora DSM 70294]EDO18932.1 hypothetical protein Kpol_1023p107 [Vanderwaltozyma polyspora DSM 70294]
MGKNQNQKKSITKQDDGLIRTQIPKTINNKEHFQRLNYLYHLTMFSKDENLSRSYVNLMDTISKKTNTKMLPSLKRTYCKKCKRVIIFDNKLSIKKIKGIERLIIECKCGHEKSFPIGLNKDYKTFYEKEGNLIEVSPPNTNIPKH